MVGVDSEKILYLVLTVKLFRKKWYKLQTIIINETNLRGEDIQKFGNKVRAVLLSDNKILVSYYGGVILLPGGSIDKGETESEAIIRELKEETGFVYDINSLEELLFLEYYQPNYPTRRDEVVNRLIRTKFYFAKYKGINLESINRTENEVKDNFCVELIELDEFISSVNEVSDNPRKKYFDRENQEVIKVLKKVRK